MEKNKHLPANSEINRDWIMAYGNDVVESISKFSVRILDKLGKVSNDDAGKILVNLHSIMKEFKLDDFSEERKGVLGKLFDNANKRVEKILAKYSSFNNDIDKIYRDIKKYEVDINDSNDILDEMFEENKNYYADLETIIDIGNKIIHQMKEELEQKDDADRIDEVELTDRIELMEKRIYDLELAKSISLQTAPQIKMLQKTNNDLLRKINSSFVITLPIFRQGIIQAITIKRQAIQTKALEGIDEATNELIIKNSENIVDNTKKAAMLNAQPIVKIETLQESYATIINGIKEVEDLEIANIAARKEGLEELKKLKEHMITGTPLEIEKNHKD